MRGIEWHEFDHNDKGETAPPRHSWYDTEFWVVETFYTGGVTIGIFDGYCWFVQGSDDCSVLFWAEMTYPDPPENWEDVLEEHYRREGC
jgi:hypothetical protein